MDLKKLTTDQLKVLVYDLMTELQRLQNNIQAVNNEIAIRAEAQAGLIAAAQEAEKETKPEAPKAMGEQGSPRA